MRTLPLFKYILSLHFASLPGFFISKANHLVKERFLSSDILEIISFEKSLGSLDRINYGFTNYVIAKKDKES